MTQQFYDEDMARQHEKLAAAKPDPRFANNT